LLPTPCTLGPRAAAALAGMVILAALVRGSVDVIAHAQQAARRGQATPLARFSGNLELMDFNLPRLRASAGSDIPLTLIWRTSAPAPEPLSVFVHVYAADGALWGQSDKLDPADNFPATRWPPFALLRAEHTVAVFPDAPPGRYTLAVGVWYRPTGARMPVLDAAGQPTAETFYVLSREVEIAAP
jgi:hypothetical protein